MILSLKDAEILLIERNLITREEIESLKEKKLFGKSNCKACGRFKKAVNEDYRPFFPEKPCKRSFSRTADRLFRSGGYKDFPRSESKELSNQVTEVNQLPSTRASSRASANIVYTEEEEIETTPVLQTKDFFVKSSQKLKGEGKGSNNPKLPSKTKHFLFSQMAGGTSLPDMLKINKDYHLYFDEFHDSADSASPSRATLYRVIIYLYSISFLNTNFSTKNQCL